MSKNETLAFRDLMYEIERKPRHIERPKALCKEKQDLFTYLCNLTGNEFKAALKEWTYANRH